MPSLKCYAQGRVVPKLVAARPHRAWMDSFPGRHPYRCLPLAIANTFGWELLSPCDVRMDYTGGPNFGDITITAEDGFPLVEDFAMSNFSHGIVSFHTGYLFTTDPGWALYATGPLNEAHDGMSPLTGYIETDWLPYPFTMNWQLTRPGTYRFKKGEAFCHIFPVQVEPLMQIEPEILNLETNPDLKRRLESYRDRRVQLRENQRREHEAGNDDAPSWTREYFQGKLADGTEAAYHLNKLRLAEPVDNARRNPKRICWLNYSASNRTNQRRLVQAVPLGSERIPGRPVP